jgi:hypothetical protein
MSKEWVMPEWMEKYRNHFQNTGGNSIERLMNCKTDASSNLLLASLCIAVESKVYLLNELHRKGIL